MVTDLFEVSPTVRTDCINCGDHIYHPADPEIGVVVFSGELSGGKVFRHVPTHHYLAFIDGHVVAACCFWAALKESINKAKEFYDDNPV